MGFDPFGALAGIVGGGLGFMVGGPLGSAIGSGLATTAYSGDLGKGIVSGLMSYGLGSAGELLGAGGSEVASAAIGSGGLESASQVLPEAMGGALEGTATAATEAIKPNGIEALIEANRTLKPWEISEKMGRIGQGLTNPQTLQNTFVNNAMSTTMPIGLGAYGMMQGNPQQLPAQQAPQQQMPYVTPYGTGRKPVMPGPGYDYSQGKEFNYFPQRFADGGDVEDLEDQGEMTLEEAEEWKKRLDERDEEGAMMDFASPNPFTREPSPTFRFKRGGYISGPGGGIADAIPAVIDGTQPAALSSGEWVGPAHFVSALGDGSTEEGVRQLDGMVDRVMKKKFGSKNRQPKPLRYPSRYMPA